MLRAGLVSFDDMQLRFEESNLPESIGVAIDFKHKGIPEINEMCQALKALPGAEQAKLDAVVTVVMFVSPSYASQVRQLVENPELFELIPNVHTPEEYGKFMIQESGRFEFDPNLEDF